MSLLLALPLMLAQIGPFTPPGGAPVSPLPPELRDRPQSQNRKPRPQASPQPPAEITAEAPSTGTTECLKHAATDPTAAVDQARAWRDGTADVERAAADLCLGTALSELQRFGEATALPSPHADSIRDHFAFIVANRFESYAEAGRVADAERLLRTAYTELEKNAALHPLDVRIAVRRAQIALRLATRGGRRELLPEAERELAAALDVAPRRQDLYFTLAAVEVELGKAAEAVHLLERV